MRRVCARGGEGRRTRRQVKIHLEGLALGHGRDAASNGGASHRWERPRRARRQRQRRRRDAGDEDDGEISHSWLAIL